MGIFSNRQEENCYYGNYYRRNRLITRSTCKNCLVTHNTPLTTLSTRLPTLSTCLSTRSICLSILSTRLSTRITHTAISWSFYN